MIFVLAGWSDNLQFMKTQLQLKKAAVKGPTGFVCFTFSLSSASI